MKLKPEKTRVDPFTVAVNSILVIVTVLGREDKGKCFHS